MGHLAREGKNMRLNFKVGYINITNQLMQWQHSRELLRRHKPMRQSIDGISRASSQCTTTTSERNSQCISVITPSVAHYSRATSTDYKNHHISNPNPQATSTRFYGPRDFNSSTPMGMLNQTAPLDSGSPLQDQAELVRFGKRVSINRMTNKELLEDHLKEMRQHLIEKKHQRDLQIQQDQNYIKRTQARDRMESENKKRSNDMLKDDFHFFNG